MNVTSKHGRHPTPDLASLSEVEASLQETQRRITAVLNASTEPIMLVNRQGRMLVLNEAMVRRIGKPGAELIGQHAPSLQPLAPVRIRAHWLEQVFLSGQPVRFEDELDGRYFKNSLYPVLDQDGRVTTVAVYVSDMTDLKLATVALQLTNAELERRVAERTAELQRANQALRDGEARFRALFEQAGVGVVLVDSRTGHFVQVNQKCCDFVGYTPAEMRQLNFKDITHPEDLANDLVHAKLLNEGRVREFSYEKRYYHKSGRIVWGLLSMTPLWLPGEPPHYRVAVVEDITVRKLMEQRLREANVVLKQQAVRLRELASELTLTEQRERQRVAGVLHDDLQQLLISARFHLAGVHHVRNKVARQAAAQVEALIVQSIECSRTLSAELSPPILQTGGLLPALEWLASWTEQKHGLAVKVVTHRRALPQMEIGSTLLFQAVRELLLNVVKHARVKTASIEVHRKVGQICVVVADQGRGFNPAQIKARKDRISGLGLFSIRDRLELMGGQLEIESVPGAGSRLILTMPWRWFGTDKKGGPVRAPKPAAGAGATDVAAGADADQTTRKIRILVVDDHAVVRDSFVQLLNGEADIEVVDVASNGAEAIERTRRLKPDIVTMDVSMKGMSGIEATKLIHAELPQTRVIGLSMFEESGTAAAMRQAGAVEYLTKSSPAKTLLATIRAVVRAAPAQK